MSDDVHAAEEAAGLTGTNADDDKVVEDDFEAETTKDGTAR